MNRQTDVEQFINEFRSATKHVTGVGVLLAPQILTEVIGLITFIESMGGSERRLTPRIQALREVLQIRRVDATDRALETLFALSFQRDVDSNTAAAMLGMRPDTLRKHLRLEHIEGRRVNGHWRVPLSVIEEHNNNNREAE